mmetsp:Transcript_21828/g.40786  ORF Transcript_21828/g.40786 Transcript_21828/m.40786 type:complete len:259 (-) Transcript_21828:60-836(-)
MSVSGMISPRRVVTPTPVRNGAGKAGATSPPRMDGRIANQVSGTFSPQTGRHSPSSCPGGARADAPPPVSRLHSRPGTPLPGTPLQGMGQPGCFAPPRSPGMCTPTALVSPRMINSPRSMTPTVAHGHSTGPALGAASVNATISAPSLTGTHAAGGAAGATGAALGTPRTALLARGGSLTVGSHIPQISAPDSGSLDLPAGGLGGSFVASSQPRSMSTSPSPRTRSPGPLGPIVTRAQTPGRFVKAATVMGPAVQAWK